MTYTLGIDSSTQSVKALVYDTEARSVVTTVAVNFGKELPVYSGYVEITEGEWLAWYKSTF